MRLLNCITAFIDIDRGSWSSYDRSNKKYIDSFNLFYGTLQTNVTIFVEPSSLPMIKRSYEEYKNTNGFKSTVNFQEFDRRDLYYFKILDKIEKIQASESMKRYSQRDSSGPPEYTKPAWVATMLCKPLFLQLAKQRNLIPVNTTAVAWSDFGIAHGYHNQPYIDTLTNKKLLEPNTDKAIIFNRRNFEPKPDPWAINGVHDGDDAFCPGGFYIVPVKLIDEFNLKFHRIVQELLIDNELIDDDQTLLAILSGLHRDISMLVDSTRFKNNPSEGDYFPVFDFLKG